MNKISTVDEKGIATSTECEEVAIPSGEVSKKRKMVAIVGGGGGFLGTAAASLLCRENISSAEVIVVDPNTCSIEDLAKMELSKTLSELKKIEPPKLSYYGEEKKKKKPCTSHEYVQELREDSVGSNLFISTWRCRHCNHPLK